MQQSNQSAAISERRKATLLYKATVAYRDGGALLKCHDRFWSRVDKGKDKSSCWLWRAGKSNGYGTFMVGSRNYGAHRISWGLTMGGVPKGLWVLHNCPGGDNPACVNPAHLFLGTNLDNMRDMIKKGRKITVRGDAHYSRTHPELLARGDRNGARAHIERMPRGDNHYSRTQPWRLARGDRHSSKVHPERVPRGENHANSKLTESKVRCIRNKYSTGKYFFRELAAEFRVSLGAIDSCINRTWRHVK